MVRSSKLGIAANQKIKLNVRLLANVFLAVAWLSSLAACSSGYVAVPELTTTAQPLQSTAVVSNSPTIRLIPSQTSQIPATFTPVFTRPVSTSIPTQVLQVQTPKPTIRAEKTRLPPILYYTQAGDTLPVLANRFNTEPGKISSPDQINPTGFLKPGQLLIIPNGIGETSPVTSLLPDSEVVYSPSTLDFDINKYVSNCGGYLSTYKEYLSNGWNTGAQVVQRVAVENSINPRLLLSLLEYQSHWVKGQPANISEIEYPLGYIEANHQGLFKQLSWSVQQISIGYYNWRAGLFTELKFIDNSILHLAPVQYFFSILTTQAKWNSILYTTTGYPSVHEAMFENLWIRAQTVEPLFPPNLTQPHLELPFRPGHTWSYTGGPHSAWGPNGALAALDLAPSSAESGCAKAVDYVTAMAPGLVIRSGGGAVVVDLDGDGQEQTGWVILYMHIATAERVPTGTWLNTDDFIGYPSCEGGNATGTHVHIARKYNGEWMLSDGPIPFNIGGWIAHNGKNLYEGSLTYGDKIAVACTCSSFTTLVNRPKTN
jgi:LasA protease